MSHGFILQSTYRLEAGRPVVLLYGLLESGRPFLVRDDRQVPHFYVRRTDVEGARGLGARIVTPQCDKVNLAGEPVARIDLDAPQDCPPLRDRLIARGIECYEADVRFAYRYLIDRGIRGSLEIRGLSRTTAGVGEVFENPEIARSSWVPAPRVLSVDIETDPQARRLLSIALVGCGAEEVLLLAPAGSACPARAVPFPSERALLQGFVARLAQIDPDVLTGWNFIEFDLAVLSRLAQQWGVRLRLGRGPGPLALRRPGGSSGQAAVTIPGRVVLDGIQLLRSSFVKLESYALNPAAREILGRGKTITGHDRGQAILDAFENDRQAFVEYNLNDARLVLAILDELRLIALAVQRSLLTGMPLDRVAASIGSFDFLYLSELSRRNVVAPTLRTAGAAAETPTTGGHVLEPRPGLHRNVLVFDFKSLYPSIIRTFQIDPLGHVPQPAPGADLIVAPNGAAFRREPGILPGLLDDLFPRRDAAKAAGERVASQAIKILMNSFYGVLGTSACRFASPALANAITGFGREILLWSKQRIEALGLEVLYGDTDSLFVRSDAEPAEARELGRRLVLDLNRELAQHIDRTWRVQSRLELQFERLYLRLLLPAVRRGSGGARKRYAGLIEDGGTARVVFTGMEVVRRDWTKLAKRVQRELYERLFADLPVEDYLREIVVRLRAGDFDGELVYRKALRKRLSDYEASAPHVVAARRMTGNPPGIVRYLITTNGPEPADERRSAIDREHYVQHQVRAVAEPVLELVGLDFDRVIGDDAQLRLF